MKTAVLNITFGLILICGLNAQESINEPDLIKINGIKTCKVYSLETTNKDTLIQDERLISFIQEYDSKGRLIAHKEMRFDIQTGGLKTDILYTIEYEKNRTITTRIDSVRKAKEIKINGANDSVFYESIERFFDSKFKSSFIVYTDTTDKKIKREAYNKDGSVKFSYSYDYMIDTLNNSESMYVKGKIKEKIQKLSNNSEILTTYDKNEKINYIVYKNYLNDGRQRNFCQVTYSKYDFTFDFHCVEYYYNYAGRLERIDYPQQNRYELYVYNDLGLIVKHKNIDSEGYMTLKIYTYE